MIVIAKFLDAARDNAVVQIPLELQGSRQVFPDVEIKAQLEARGFQVDRVEGYSIAAVGPSFAPYAVNAAREQAILAAVRLDRVLTSGESGTLLNPYINAQAAWFKEAVRRGVDEDQLNEAIIAELDRN